MQLKEFFKKNYLKTSEKKMIRQNSFSTKKNGYVCLDFGFQYANIVFIVSYRDRSRDRHRR